MAILSGVAFGLVVSQCISVQELPVLLDRVGLQSRRGNLGFGVQVTVEVREIGLVLMADHLRSVDPDPLRQDAVGGRGGKKYYRFTVTSTR